MVQKPCPWHVHTEEGAIFCEAGPDGHDGGHIGERSQEEYLRLLGQWDRANSSGGE